MRSVDHWIQKELSRRESVVRLEDALLSRRFAAYAWYRLRYFTGRTVVSAVLHAIEFLFLSHIFRGELLAGAILVRIATGFASSWWWGSLEGLRENVRRLHRDGKLRLAPGIIVSWLVISGACAAAVVLAGFVWAVLATWGDGNSFDVFHFYVLANCMRLGLHLVSRTYHSGAYAVRRVYRPFLALTGVDLCAFVGTLALWPILGQWSFPLLAIVTSVLSAAITIHYVNNVYRALRLLPLPMPRRLRISRRFRMLIDGRFLLAGMSYALMRPDALLVFALYGESDGSDRQNSAFLAVYLMSPLIRVAHTWAQLFYFDLKRLELDLVASFRRAFGKLVARLSWLVGGVSFLLASLGAALLLPETPILVYWPLGVFLLIRSRLAFFQVSAFAERRYVPLLISGLLLLSGVLLTAFFAAGATEERIVLVALALLAALLYLASSRMNEFGALEPPEVIAAPEWLGLVASVKGPVRIRGFQICQKAHSRVAEDLARRVSREIRDLGHVTLLGRRRVVWYERQSETRALPDEWCLRIAAGLIDSIEATQYAETGSRALRSSAIWRPTEAFTDRGPMPLSIEDVKSRFLETFPDGIVYEPGTPAPRELEELSSSERHEILHGAIQYSKNLFVPSRSRGFEVTTLCQGGEIRLVFVVRKREPARDRAQWRSYLSHVNLGADGGFLRMQRETASL